MLELEIYKFYQEILMRKYKCDGKSRPWHYEIKSYSNITAWIKIWLLVKPSCNILTFTNSPDWSYLIYQQKVEMLTSTCKESQGCQNNQWPLSNLTVTSPWTSIINTFTNVKTDLLNSVYEKEKSGYQIRFGNW